VLRGFGDFDAVASSHSLTGDFVVVGRNQTEMARALNRVIELGGGVCLRNQGDCVFEMAMPMFQTMSLEPMDVLMDAARRFDEHMRAFGYAHEDPVYTLLFLSATHLPAVRLTERGVNSRKNVTEEKWLTHLKI
jgi:adenine deaminase